MINPKKQSGSALAIISVIIIVIIIAGLGFALWKNATSKTVTQTSTKGETTSTTTDNTSKLIEAHIASTFPSPLSWKYPASWTLTSTGNGPTNPSDTVDQGFTMTSPSGDYSVVYRVGVNGGVGGTCDPTSSGTVQYIREEPINNFAKGQFVEYITDDYTTTESSNAFSGYYYMSAILSNEAAITQAKVGSSRCDFGLSIVTLSKTQNFLLLSAAITLNKFEAKDGSVMPIKDVSLIKEAYNTAEYKDAVNILLSTKYSGQ